MANVVSVVICVKGTLENREAFYNALDIGSKTTRIGRGLEDLYELWSESDYSVYKGSANNWSMYDVLGSFASRYESDPIDLEMISLSTASKKYNLTIEALGSCDDKTEHYIYEKGKEIHFDSRRRNVFKFSKNDIEKLTLIKQSKK